MHVCLYILIKLTSNCLLFIIWGRRKQFYGALAIRIGSAHLLISFGFCWDFVHFFIQFHYVCVCIFFFTDFVLKNVKYSFFYFNLRSECLLYALIIYVCFISFFFLLLITFVVVCSQFTIIRHFNEYDLHSFI